MAKSFSRQIQEYAEKYNQRIDDVVADYAIGVSSQIIQRTPVGNPSTWQSDPPPGYVGGTARANWLPSIGQPETSPEDTVDSARLNGELEYLREKIPGNIFYLTNNVPYIERLEYGWSKQAPKGMFRRTLREARKLLNAAVKKNTR